MKHYRLEGKHLVPLTGAVQFQPAQAGWFVGKAR
ncbi:hypothetical protein GALL_367970 [mine drainage metagenome]|uniref:Uncharacterized protein n=1 Tax=mine drainage metagenome TaxID=410659 RepID=A0A1J5QE05_9ZZZZ